MTEEMNSKGPALSHRPLACGGEPGLTLHLSLAFRTGCRTQSGNSIKLAKANKYNLAGLFPRGWGGPICQFHVFNQKAKTSSRL